MTDTGDVVTIDGLRGTGKSELARSLRALYRCPVFEVGPVFRIIALEHSLDASADLAAVAAHVVEAFARGEITWDGWLDGSRAASTFRRRGQAISESLLWGEELSASVRACAEDSGVVSAVQSIVKASVLGSRAIVVGREVGSRFFPHADIRVQLVARRQVRTERKAIQLSGTADPGALEKVELSEPRSIIVGRGMLRIDTTHGSLDSALLVVSAEIEERLGWNPVRMNDDGASESSRAALDRIQDRVVAWQRDNFPGCEEWELALGVAEEAGELAQCVLKMHRRIRTSEFSEERLQDAIGDIVIYLMGLCNQRGWDLSHVIETTAARVLARDWTSDHKTEGLSGGGADGKRAPS